MKTTTLTLKKPANPGETKPPRPEKRLVGKDVRLQTRSKHVLVGKVVSFDGGWLVIEGVEHHWQADGSLSSPVSSGRFTLDRNTVQFIAEAL